MKKQIYIYIYIYYIYLASHLRRSSGGRLIFISADDGDYEGDNDGNEYLHNFLLQVFHFGLRLLGRANEHAYCHHIHLIMHGKTIFKGTHGIPPPLLLYLRNYCMYQSKLWHTYQVGRKKLSCKIW